MKTTITYSQFKPRVILVVLTTAIFLIFLILALVYGDVATRITTVVLFALTIGSVYFLSRAYSSGELTGKIKYKSLHADRFKWTEDENDKADIKEVKTQMPNDATGFKLFKTEIKDFDPNCEVEDDTLFFTYQGGYFQAKSIGANIVRMSFPKIYSTGVLMQDMLCRSINRINSLYAMCKLVATASSQDMSVIVSGFADFPYTADNTARHNMMRDIFAVFFDMQRSLLVSMSVSEILDQEPGAPEMDEYSTSYKDISLN